MIEPRGVLNGGVGFLNARGFDLTPLDPVTEAPYIGADTDETENYIISRDESAPYRQPSRFKIHSGRQGIYVGLWGTGGTNQFSTASEYNSWKTIFEAALTKWEEYGFTFGFGLGYYNATEMTRPGGTTLPNNCYENSFAIEDEPTTAELNNLFQGAESAASVTHATNTRNSFRMRYNQPTINNSYHNYDDFCGLNEDGTSSAAAGLIGDGNLAPPVTGQWVFGYGQFGTRTILKTIDNWPSELSAAINVFVRDLGWRPNYTSPGLGIGNPGLELPAPTSFSAVAGGSPGEVDCSWTTPDANYAPGGSNLFAIFVGTSAQQVTDKMYDYTLGNLQATPTTLTGLPSGVTMYMAVCVSEVAAGYNLTGGLDIEHGVLSNIQSVVVP